MLARIEALQVKPSDRSDIVLCQVILEASR